MSALSDNEKNTDIEVLRAVAILYTVIGHLTHLFPWQVDALEWLKAHAAFWTGVDLFFVISGFVISRSLLRTEPRRAASGGHGRTLKAFWVKRVFRLLPSAWLWLLVALIASVLLPASSGFMPINELWRHLCAAFLNVANFAAGHFTALEGTHYLLRNPLIHYWSLSLEEQFYIVLPILVLFVPQRWLLLAVVVGIVVQFNYNRLLFSMAWYLRTDALLWGVLLGLCFEHPLYRRVSPTFLRWRIPRIVFFWALLALLAWLPVELAGFDFSTGRVPASCAIGVIALVSAVTVFVASFNNDFLMRAGRLKTILVALGARSYSLYLVHFIVFAIVVAVYRVLFPTQTEAHTGAIIVLSVLGIGLSLLLTEVNYRFIELPIRQQGRRIAARL